MQACRHTRYGTHPTNQCHATVCAVQYVCGAALRSRRTVCCAGRALREAQARQRCMSSVVKPRSRLSEYQRRRTPPADHAQHLVISCCLCCAGSSAASQQRREQSRQAQQVLWRLPQHKRWTRRAIPQQGLVPIQLWAHTALGAHLQSCAASCWGFHRAVCWV